MSEKTRLIIRYNGLDVSDDIELTEGRGNPFGWSQHRLVHNLRAGVAIVPVEIGWLECGEPDITEPGYSAEVVDE